MKSLTLLALLSLPLAAQGSLERYMPGHDKDLYHMEQDAKRNEATVVIEGQLDPETVKQLRFQEFMAWFIPDLHKFLGRYGDTAPARPLAIQATDPPAQAKVYPVTPPASF